MLFFVAVAVIIVFSQIIYIKIFLGEVDNAINSARYNPRWSFNKILNKKMENYDKGGRWLLIYTNVLLPTLSVVSIYGIISNLVEGQYIVNFSFVLHIISVMMTIINTIIIRNVDDMAFFANALFCIIWIADVIVSSGTLFAIMLAICVPALALNLVYFFRRRDLFFKNGQNQIG